MISLVAVVKLLVVTVGMVLVEVHERVITSSISVVKPMLVKMGMTIVEV